jgi:hypothetical protein
VLPDQGHGHVLLALQYRVCEVRTAATSSLYKLAQVAGPEWIQSHVLPGVEALYDESFFYLTRVTVHNALKVRRSVGRCDLQSVRW